jgi:hypothetical protein
MEQKANELIGGQGHYFLLAVVAIVLVAELHLTIFDIQQAVVGDGDTMSIASHVIEYLLGPGKGWLGIDDPFCLPERSEIRRDGSRLLKFVERGKEMQLVVAEGLLQSSRNKQRNKLESTRTGKKKPGRQEIQRSPSGESPSPGTTQRRWG